VPIRGELHRADARREKSFVPKIPSMRLVDLAETIAPGCEIETIGIRPGRESCTRCWSSEDEARQLRSKSEDRYIIQPSHPWWAARELGETRRSMPEGFRYASDNNDRWADEPRTAGN